jgi:hypothetical protein
MSPTCNAASPREEEEIKIELEGEGEITVD